MELVELEIGELGAGAEGHGGAVAGSHGGVGGVEVELAGSAACDDHGVGFEGVGKAFGINDFEARNGAVFED